MNASKVNIVNKSQYEGGGCDVSFSLPFPPVELSPNSRKHWAVMARAKKVYRASSRLYCFQALKGRKVQADRVVVTLVFYPPDKRRRDKDNLLARMKAGIDGIADAVGIDDSRFDYAPWRIAEKTVPQGRVDVALSFLPKTTAEVTKWNNESKSVPSCARQQDARGL
jgi:crossover junction endodeoxyribonuclease RusA